MGQAIRFCYRKNHKITVIRLQDKGNDYLGRILLEENEQNENKEKWLNDIWNQFVEHFNLRIRLMFINETTPWKWDTEFTY